jgi:hypothetical protein
MAIDGEVPSEIPPGKESRYAFYRRLLWAPEPVWTGAENIVHNWGLIPGTFCP